MCGTRPRVRYLKKKIYIQLEPIDKDLKVLSINLPVKVYTKIFPNEDERKKKSLKFQEGKPHGKKN